MTDSAQLDHKDQRTVAIGRWIAWCVYLLGAASLLVLWFVAGSTWISYLFGGWMMIGAVGLWLVEDAVEY